MPQQELFVIQQTADQRIEILKTYDQAYTREVFAGMDQDAQARLWSSLVIEENVESEDIPAFNDSDREDFLWDELLDAAREDGNLRSFFVVTSSGESTSTNLYVSPDWPSAEAFANSVHLHR